MSQILIILLNTEDAYFNHYTAQKSFPLRIPLLNMTKSAVSCGFDHIY